MKKTVLIIFGVVILLVLSITLFNFMKSTNKSEYNVDSDYQSVTIEILEVESTNEGNTPTGVEESVEDELTETRTLQEAESMEAVLEDEEVSEVFVSDSAGLIDNNSESLVDKPAETITLQENTMEVISDNSVVVDRALEDTTIEDNLEAYDIDEIAGGFAIDLEEIANIKEASFTEDNLSLEVDITESNDYVTYTGDQWVDEQVNEHIDEIAEDDLSAGIALSNKVDFDTIYEYLDDGLTEEEEVALKSYLQSMLTDSEIQQLESLFSKYQHLLNE